MSLSLQRAIAVAIGVVGVILGVVGITATDLALMAMGAVLLFACAVFEQRHPVNHRRAFAARFSLWSLPIVLLLLGYAWLTG